MTDIRIKVATSVIAAVLSVLGSARAVAAAPTEVRYACDSRQGLVVTRFDEAAAVRFVDRTYELKRKPSSIGEKYASHAATLIIDGPSAVFVAEDRLQLGACEEAIRLASAE